MVPDDSVNRISMESLISDYIARELASDQGTLHLKNDTPLLDSHIIDSLSLLRLVLFLEEKFGFSVGQDELVPENFGTIDAICKYVQSKKSR